jgi:hypothetical protein
MLGVKSYSQEYIDACRAKVAAQVAAYDALARAAKKAKAAPLGSAMDAFEPVFFNNMVLVLDSFFTHRLRGMEGKDGNPLNEVRVIQSSLVENDGRLAADTTIKLKAASSVLGYELGDEIQLEEADFTRLAEAYFTEIEKRYT